MDMSDTQAEFEVLLSGYLDGELDGEQRARFEALLEERPSRREEVESMRQLFVGTSALFAEARPPEEAWDTFLDDVYNRAERRVGWIVLVFGVIALALFGLYHFFTEPWGSALLKTLIATPVAGLSIVFVSVLRNRLHTLKTDRYSREVHR
jgi:anti-sigma factor RsiW